MAENRTTKRLTACQVDELLNPSGVARVFLGHVLQEPIRRLIRRWNAWVEADIEFKKTDEQKARDARHTALTEKIMREQAVSRVEAAAAASVIMYEEVYRKDKDEDELPS